MRHILTFGLLLAALAPARQAAAQSHDWPERAWVSVSGGVQPAANSFSDTFDVPLYAETEKVTIDYPVKGGALIAVSGGYRVWKRLAIGVGVTRDNRRADASVSARAPHPFFDNQFRQVDGKVRATRNELGAHLLIGWMMPITNHVRLLLTAGPSVLNVGQTLVTGVDITETYPFDTAAFRGATTTDATATATGFNAGADVSWMFSRTVDAGGLVQVTRARAREKAGSGRSIPVDAGGAQAAVGLRFVF